jgi:hypothetical protein
LFSSVVSLLLVILTLSGVEWERLNVQSYPDSSNAYDSLGEAYMKSWQKQLAIENYKKSLEEDPTNDNAKQKPKDLEGSAPAAK